MIQVMDSARAGRLFNAKSLSKVRAGRKYGLALIVATVLSIALTSCSQFGESVGQTIGDHVQSKVANSPVTIDLRKVVSGSWSRILIVCGPVSRSTVDHLLGFEWTPPGGHFEVNDSVLLFVDHSSVIAHYVAGVDDAIDSEVFTPCFPPGHPNSDGSAAIRQAIVVPRRDSVLSLTADKGPLGTIWYISSAERARLAGLNNS